MRIRFYISIAMKENLWFEKGRIERQKQEIILDHQTLSPAIRKTLGAVDFYQIPLEDAFEIDPENKEQVTEQVLDWLNKLPAKKERQSLQYRISDLEKKKENLDRSIKLTEGVSSNLVVKIQNDFSSCIQEATRLREEATRILERADQVKEQSIIDLNVLKAKTEERKVAMAATLDLIDNLRAQLDAL